MARTKIRASQFKLNDITNLQLENSTIIPSNMSATPIELISVSGVITLVNSTNSFLAKGQEAITQITGISNGLIAIKWEQERSIIHSDGVLELNKNVNRNVAAGDISLFILRNGVAEEISYKTAITEQQTQIYEFVAIEGQTDIPLAVVPLSKDNILFTINGLLQAKEDYVLASNIITVESALELDDKITVIILEKAIVQLEAGDNVIDCGTF